MSANLSVRPCQHARIAVEGEEVMDALLAITHRRTVPQVFIKGEFIGGCDGELCLQPAYAGLPVASACMRIHMRSAVD